MALLPLVLTLATCPTQDDASTWRVRDPGPSAEAWDAMEGRLYPGLGTLEGWVNSDPLDWKALEGHVVLVHHFATSKRSSTRLVPELVELYQQHRGEGLAVLGVHTRRDAADCQRWVIKHGVPYHVAVDGEGKLGRQASAKRVPTLHLVGRDGHVLVAGLRPDAGVIAAAVRSALAEPWSGVRAELQLTPRIWTDWRPPEQVRLPAGPGGWPATDATEVSGARDIRGEHLPPMGVTHWLTDPVDLHGHVGLVVLWATTDGFTIRDLPRLQAVHERFGEELVVLALSEEAPDAHARTEKRPYGNRVRDHLAKREHLTFPVALDGRRELKQALRVVALPQALLVDSQGIVRWQGTISDPAGGFGEELVERVLAVDRLGSGGTQARYDGVTYQLGQAPSGLRGLLFALPVRAPLLGPTGAWPLGVLGPVGSDGYLGLELPPAGALGPGSLAWRPLPPSGYTGRLPVTIAR